MRHDGRAVQQLRPIKIETNVFKHPEGSVVISFGDTKVICSATLEDSVPPFLRGSESGWVTAEYSMLPRATNTRNRRESSKGKLSGRTMEIQRLIGRSLRAVIDLEKLGERSIIVDCDVIQADGGTRTASITGGFVALRLAVNKLLASGELAEDPIKEHLAAISVGMLPDGTVVTDLDYLEDSSAAVDMNLVMTESGRFVEIQGTGDYPDLPDVEETGTTFEENARLKAETIAQLLQQPVLADDSGLVVDVLNGMPGIFSARFAGERKSDAANNAKLLHELTNVPDEQRTAHFHCTLVFAAPQKESLVVEADWDGRIARIPQGDNGFGYDPLFIVPGYDKTSAELTSEEKNKISHRGMAVKELERTWKEWLEGNK